MSIKGEKGQGLQQPVMKVGQDLPRKTIVMMLLSGVLLAGWLIVPLGEGWWSPGREIVFHKEKLLALVFASMFLANSFLKNNDPARFDREFSTIAIGIMALVAAFVVVYTTSPKNPCVAGVTVLAMLPLIIAIISTIKDVSVWPLLLFIKGLLMYVIVTIVSIGYHTIGVAPPSDVRAILGLVVILGIVSVFAASVWPLGLMWRQTGRNHKKPGK